MQELSRLQFEFDKHKQSSEADVETLRVRVPSHVCISANTQSFAGIWILVQQPAHLWHAVTW